MKSSIVKSVLLSLLLVLGVSFAGAATLTVGPGMQYATPCPAIKAASPGDTITIDYNNGIPYQEPPDPTEGNRSDCVWYTNGLTIVGVNGRPILDASGETIQKAILDDHGGDTVISNLELRNAKTPQGQGGNGSGVRIEYGNATTPYGGNVTVEFCYIHNNEDGVLTDDVGPGSGEGAYPDQVSYYPNPYVTLMYDELYYNGTETDDPGNAHNVYNGFDGNLQQVFTMEYSWSHDSLVGHVLKTRAPYNDVYYNMIGDALGNSSFILDFPLGGSTYVVGNVLYKSKVTNGLANKLWMFWRDDTDNYSYDPVYSTPNEDLHFINNTVVLDPQDAGASFVITACENSDFTTCPAPNNGPVLTTNEVVQNNIFVGPYSEATNQLSAVQSNNLIEANTPANLAALFVDPAHLNYHLVAGAAAIGAGLYPPTDNTRAADPKALAADEYVPATAGVARPTPSGATMDEGAYSYPRADTPPTPSLSYTQSVTTPGTGTITLTGLPTPPAGQYNVAGFVSEDPSVLTVSSATSATGTLTTTFSVCCASTQTVVPVDIYVDGAYLTANVTVVPGAVALQSITLDNEYYPQTTIHLTNAPASPIEVDLSTSDPSILYVPSSITVPANALSAETGSEIGSLWGQTPSRQTATITATYGGDNVSLPVPVVTPRVNHFYCNLYDPYCDVVGGTPVNIAVGISTDLPIGGGPVVFTSDTPSVIPNQTFTGPAGSWYTTFNLVTNPVMTTTNVTLSVDVNGFTTSGFGGLTVITVTPPSSAGTQVAVYSGNDQSAAVGSYFPSGLAASVTSGSSPVSGATVTFAGTGVSFPPSAAVLTSAAETGNTYAQWQAIDNGGFTITFNGTVEHVTGINMSSLATDYSNFSSLFNAALPAGLTYNSPGGGVTVLTTTATGAGASLSYGSAPTDGSQDISAMLGILQSQGATLLEGSSGVGSGTAVTNAKGIAQVAMQPTTTGTLTVTATTPGASVPATFTETGTGGTTVAVVSGSGQSAPVGTTFTNPLVVLVKDVNSNPISGATVTFAGTGISFPSGATAVTNSSGEASVTAQPTTAGVLNIMATVVVEGVNSSASFSETGSVVPASIAAVSGSGQSTAVGTNFANPLVVVVEDASGNPDPGVTVTFAGTNFTFPAGATAVTNSSGDASVTVQPTAKGTSLITASVAGVATPATFSESATPQVILTSVTVDKFQHGAVFGPGTTVTISTRATTPIVIQLSSSNPSVLYAPPTVTIPVGANSAETGTLLGSVFPAANNPEPAVLTANYAGVTQTAALNVLSPTVTLFACVPAACNDVVGGNTYNFTFQESGNAPVGGGTVQFTSDNPDVFPNQSIVIPAGQVFPVPHRVTLNTNAVTTTTTIHVTANYGSTFTSGAINVTPPGVPKDLTVVSGSGQTAAVNTIPFASPLVVLVTDQKGNPVLPGTAVTFAGTGVSFPAGTNAVTDSAGHAQVTAQPATTGTLTITASVSGIKNPITFTETGTPPPASVAAVSGAGQTAAAGTAFANPLVVTVADASGNPVVNAMVTFAGDGSSFPTGATVLTNSSGQAQVTAVAPTTALGAFTITATVPGVAAPATFAEANTPGPPANIAVLSGSGQTAATGTTYASPLVVIVKDVYSNLVPGVTVTFAGAGAGFPAGATAVTNSSGIAQVTADPVKTDVVLVTASVVGVATPASFSEIGTGTAFALDNGGYGSGIWVPAGHPSTYCSNSDGDGTNSYIDTSLVTNPAPQEVYQNEREAYASIGNVTCTIPGLTPGAIYTVRLHFAEIAINGPGQRVFNVLINGTQVLTNFDIFATAGAWNKAVVESFPVVADSNGNIAVEYANGTAGNASGNGIEVIFGTDAPSSLGAIPGSPTQMNLSWYASSTPGVTYSVFRSITSGFTPGSDNQIASGISGLTYSDTGLTPGTYYYLVEAVDSAGVATAPSNQASYTVVIKVDDANTSLISYSGNWTHGVNQPASDYDSTESWTHETGDSATFTFTGTSVQWIGSYYLNHGIAEVYLDGVDMGPVDQYATGTVYGVVLFDSGTLPSGTHTLKLVCTGTKDPGATNDNITIDYFQYH